MDISFLPQKIQSALNFVSLSNLCEIRLRLNFPIIIKLDDMQKYLGNYGETLIKSNALFCDKQDIEYVLSNVTERSMYAFNEQIKRGYISYKNGVRIGVAGECVFDCGQVVTIKNISSINIRVPHEIVGCADAVYTKILEKGQVLNTLIISPPGCGKTTLLKDIVRKLNAYENNSILVVDERGEFELVKGEKIDTASYCDKLFAFNYGIRSMSPNIIVTDELSTSEDWLCANSAKNSGVRIIASCHAQSIEQVKSKNFYIDGVFDRFIVFEGNGKVGKIKGVFNSEGKVI